MDTVGASIKNDGQPEKEPEVRPMSLRNLQTHSRALWVSLVTGTNIGVVGPGRYLDIEAMLGGFGKGVDLNDASRRLSDGSSSLKLYLAILV